MSSSKTAVRILAGEYVIEGDIDLVRGARITDYMNSVQRFMVVTDVRVKDGQGNEVYSGDFINVQVEKIDIVLPLMEENPSVEE